MKGYLAPDFLFTLMPLCKNDHGISVSPMYNVMPIKCISSFWWFTFEKFTSKCAWFHL